ILLASLTLVLPAVAQQPTPNTTAGLKKPVADSQVATNVLEPGDAIELRIYQEDDLNLPRVVIGQDGTIAHPLLGSLEVGGKTIERARDMIRDILAKDYLVDPRVTLTIVEYARRSFTILGHVVRPGSYDVPRNESIDLPRAIAIAGGYTRLGSPSRITVQRVVNGEKQVLKPDADAMVKDKNAKPFPILPGDIIEVGEKIFG
ncbi:MAG TPA: polysaccharide biosynthesis/export family protein, partial [Blastocatellia bacterium]|nr:polysaccharide biosynthesis/export family protein [Blastocatellia bacterium]